MNGIIDACTHDIELDEHTLQSTQKYLQNISQALTIARQELQSYETASRTAKMEADSAARERQMAEENQQRQERLNGLTTLHTSSTVALDAMRESAEKNRKAAKIANVAADELAKTAPKNETDEISQILGSGGVPATDPFARLRQPTATAA